MESRNRDDIRYSEYFIRKTIQPYSLRSKANDPKENICYRKNLTLYLNKQTAHLREGKGKDKASLKELFQSSQEPIHIFPTIIPKQEKKDQNHRSTRSLNMRDPNDWIFKKVQDFIDQQQCFDYIYAETPPSTVAVKKEEEGEKPLPPEEEIQQAILDAIKEKEMSKYFTSFYNKMQVHKLRQFRAQKEKHENNKINIKTNNNNHGLQTFFTDLKEEIDSPKKQKSSFLTNSSNFIKAKEGFEKPIKELDMQILDEICRENLLDTEHLLGIGEYMNEKPRQQNHVTEENETDQADVVELAQVETFKERKELSRFKKKNLRPGENVYKTHFKNNELYSNEQKARLARMKCTQKEMMDEAEHKKKKVIIKSSSTNTIKPKINLKEIEQLVTESSDPPELSPHFPNFGEIMGRYAAFTTPYKSRRKISNNFSDGHENEILSGKKKFHEKIYIEGENNDGQESKLNDSKETRAFNNESPFRKSFLNHSASTRYTTSNSPIKRARGLNVVDKVQGFFRTVDNFYKDTNHESAHLKQIINEASTQLEDDCNRFINIKEQPMGTLSPEFALYRQRRIFRRNLAENITNKIPNLHVFVNALHNKKQRDKFNHVILPKASALN